MKRSQTSSLSTFLTEPAWDQLVHQLKLSPREAQIVHAVFEDRKEVNIAAELGMSPHTVRTHMERLYRKVGVQSRVGLVICLVGCFLDLTANDGNGLPPICVKRSAGQCPLQPHHVATKS